MSAVDDGLNTVWFSPLERPDGTVVGAVVAVDRDGFIEGAVDPLIPGAAEALWGLLQPAGTDAPDWLTAAANAMSEQWRLGAPTRAASVEGFEQANAREVLCWYLNRHGVSPRTVIVGSLDRGIKAQALEDFTPHGK